MKTKIKAFLKRNKFFYRLYFHIGSFLLRFWGLFLKTDQNLVLFISYGGKKYDDSPQVVYEYLLSHPVCPTHRYVWAFVDPDRFPQVPNRVKVDTLAYYYTALKAGYWITNSTASRGLRFKKPQTKNILFEHGMACIKKFGKDDASAARGFRSGFHEQFDFIFIEGKQEIPLLLSAWDRDVRSFHMTGLPRNDNLAELHPEEISSIKKKLGLPSDRKVILYAPTFREFSRSSDGLNAIGIPFDFPNWKKVLGSQYVLLVTAHYEVAKLLTELPENDFVFNAFGYPELNDLLKIADIMISDYSSIVFDYAILERPIFCYGYDYDSYAKERGFYTDPDQLFSHGVLRTEKQLLKAIQELDYDAECLYTKTQLKNPYIAAYGNAAEAAVKVIFNS